MCRKALTYWLLVHEFTVAAVGIFAVGEALYVAAYQSRLTEKLEKFSGSVMMTREDWKRSWPCRSTSCRPAPTVNTLSCAETRSTDHKKRARCQSTAPF